MTNQEEIVAQEELLNIYRRNLRKYLKQQALQGEAFMQPGVTNGIREAREQIGRIKGILRNWKVVVEDYPDDDDVTYRSRIFLSYKRGVTPDEAIAHELYSTLRDKYDVFIDQSMPVGVRWAEQIQAELRRSDFVITLLSANSVTSEMVLAEVRQAHEIAAAHSGRPVILPVRLAYREPFQYPLNMYLDAINWALWNTPVDTPDLVGELRRAIVGGSLSIASAQDKARTLQSNPVMLPPPTPAAQPLPNRRTLELAEGTMDTQSSFYMVRESDPLALHTVVQQGVTITIKGPRQMGKSSLLIRTADAARAAGKRVAFLDFQLFDRAALANADLFFLQFCAWMTDQLELEPRVDQYWNTRLGNAQRCTRYIERYLLKELGAPLALAMDEVESIFDAPFRSDFFGMLRSWHNSRVGQSPWKQVDLVLVTSTEPYQLIDNLNQSPFNVGQVIELADFTPAQVTDLNARHGLPFALEDERRLVALLGGHPYLVRRALYLVASEQIHVTALFANASDERGPFGDHLRYHLFRMHNKPELVQGMRDVLRASSCEDDTIYWRLRGAGLVRREGRAVVPRNQLYAAYFREHLGK